MSSNNFISSVDAHHSLSLSQLVRLVQLTDSALPIGNFAFSNGLESALQTGVVKNATDLQEFVELVLSQSLSMDVIALLHAYRAAIAENIDELICVDRELWLRRVGEEQQLMLTRIGRKFAELIQGICPCQFIESWLKLIKTEQTSGTFPVVYGVVFSKMGASEKQAFALYQHGVANMILSASMRLMKIDHLTTQNILFEVNSNLDEDYTNIKDKPLEDMHSFAPVFDCLIGHHTQAHVRMFMN